MTANNEMRNRFLLHLGIFILSVGVLGAGILFFRWLIEKRVAEAVALRTEIQTTTKNFDALARLNGDRDKAKTYEATLQQLFPEKDQVLLFRNELKEIATARGLTSTIDITGEKLRTGSEPGKVGFVMTLTGSFENITAFVDDVFQKRYFVVFQSFGFVRQEGGYKATVNGEIFTR